MDQLKKINNIESLAGKLRGKKVFLRADFNVPIQNGHIDDVYRIQCSIPTLEFLKKEGAITVVASHIETADTETPTLEPVFAYFQEKYPEFVMSFCKDFLNTEVYHNAINSTVEGGFVLLENIRNADQELMNEKKDDVNLATYLAQGIDFYVQDAFAVSHRKHTSVSALPRLFDADRKVTGFLLHKEISALAEAVHPKTPAAVVLSGMKFSTKLPLIKKYLQTADSILVGGALFNNILKSLGYPVGVSLIDPEATYIDVLVQDPLFKAKVFIPDTVVVRDVISGQIRNCLIQDVKQNESIQDIAPIGVQSFFNKIKDMGVKTLIWNGPVGNYENEHFSAGTKKMTELAYEYAALQEGVSVFIGGGDTVAAIQPMYPDFDRKAPNIFVSTGGGAMLEFLEKDGKLPGIESLL